MKVIEDTIPQAKHLLKELLSLNYALLSCEDVLLPFGKEQKAEYKTLPQYIVKGSTVLRSAAISGFDINYPVIASNLANGASDDEGMQRFHDGIFKVGQIRQKLEDLKFAVKLDTDREALHSLVCEAVGDFTIFIISQFKLGESDDTCYLSVSEYCDGEGVTPSVLYGELLLILDRVGCKPYGYESISPYRQGLVDIDPNFVAECEEHNFPLTEEMSKSIVEGTMQISQAQASLVSFMQQQREREIKGLSPANMIERLHLS